MWVLVMWVCGSMCSASVVPGVYEKIETCEAALAKVESKTSILLNIRVEGSCIPAPDYVTYE